MKAANRQAVIDELIAELRKGGSYSHCLKVVGGNRGVPSSTFDRYWKKALAEHKEQQEAIKIKVAADTALQAIEQQKAASMAEIKRKEYLTDIIEGTIKIKRPIVTRDKEGKAVIMEYPAEPDHSDRINAIKELNRMEGAYPAPKGPVDEEGKTMKYILLNNVFPSAEKEI